MANIPVSFGNNAASKKKELTVLGIKYDDKGISFEAPDVSSVLNLITAMTNLGIAAKLKSKSGKTIPRDITSAKPHFTGNDLFIDTD